jgi:hypothetical protein
MSSPVNAIQAVIDRIDVDDSSGLMALLLAAHAAKNCDSRDAAMAMIERIIRNVGLLIDDWPADSFCGMSPAAKPD